MDAAQGAHLLGLLGHVWAVWVVGVVWVVCVGEGAGVGRPHVPQVHRAVGQPRVDALVAAPLRDDLGEVVGGLV